MAKKSARSKGYRTYKKPEQKGFTDKEIKILVIGFIALIVIVLCVIFIPDAIENSKLLKVKDGVVVDMGDNWLIKNSGTSKEPKFRKLAEVNPAEGFELSKTDSGIYDEQEVVYYFAATAEDAPVQEYYTMACEKEYDELAANSYENMSRYVNEIFYQSEVVEEEVDGKKVAYYVMEYSMSTTEADETTGEETTKTEYYQTANLYLDTGIRDHSVLVSANRSGEDQSVFGDRESLVEAVKEATKTIVTE